MNTRNRRLLSALILMLLGLPLTLQKAYGKEHSKISTGIPNVDLIVTAQKTTKSSENGLYLVKLYCGLGSCSLQMLILNDCEMSSAGTQAFTPKVFNWSTWLGNLSVQPLGQDRITATVFQTIHQGLPAHLTFRYVPARPFAQQVKNFEATGFVDLKGFPHEIKTFDLAPISSSRRLFSLDCPVLAPTIE